MVMANIVRQWKEGDKNLVWYGPFKTEGMADIYADTIVNGMDPELGPMAFVDVYEHGGYIVKLTYFDRDEEFE